MALEFIEWHERGYFLLLVEVGPTLSHLFVSADGKSYAIYDRIRWPFKDARRSIRFDPTAYKVVPPPYPITRERAINGETGIPAIMEPMVKQMG